MIINTKDLREMMRMGDCQLCFKLADRCAAEEGTIEVEFETTNNLSNYSLFLYEDECTLFDEDGEEVLLIKNRDSFRELVNMILSQDKEVIKETMLKALDDEDYETLERLIKLL